MALAPAGHFFSLRRQRAVSPDIHLGPQREQEPIGIPTGQTGSFLSNHPGLVCIASGRGPVQPSFAASSTVILDSNMTFKQMPPGVTD